MKWVRLRPSARRDLREAVEWYRERDENLANRFLDEVYATFALIERFPNLGGAVYGISDPQVRQLPVSNFPYQVIFRRRSDTTIIVAIAHERKRPGYWNR